MELKGFLNSVFAREKETSLSRREALAGLSLFGALLAAPNLIASGPAEAKPLDKPAEPRDSSRASDAKESEGQAHVAEARDADVDVTDLSSRRHWHRRHWGWRRRHWGWRRRHWGWRRRHWGWRRRHWGWRHRRWRRYW